MSDRDDLQGVGFMCMIFAPFSYELAVYLTCDIEVKPDIRGVLIGFGYTIVFLLLSRYYCWSAELP